MRVVAFVLGACLAMPAWATTYHFAGGVFSTRVSYKVCDAGACANFPIGGRVTGSFTTAVPLAANLPVADRSAALTGYSFSDGVTTYSSANANARLYQVEFGTDAAGVPSGVVIRIQQWQQAAPHDATNDRYDELQIAGLVAGLRNVQCTMFIASPHTGVADGCGNGSTSTPASSFGASNFARQWSVDVPIAIPPNVATTYYLASGPYTTRFPHATCTVGICADLPLGGRIAGSFTTAARIPNGVALADVSGLVSSWQFTDGATTFSSADAQTRAPILAVGTDAGGVPVDPLISLHRWQAPGPHAAGSRLDLAYLTSSNALATVNQGCGAVDANDICTALSTWDDDAGVAASSLPLRASAVAPLDLALTPVTYALSSAPYGAAVGNHTTCTEGTCADFTAAMRTTGTFTLADRLPPNFALADVSGLVASYAIADGVTTHSSADPRGRIAMFRLALGADSLPVDSVVILHRWQANAVPHLAGNRFDAVSVTGGAVNALANAGCSAAATRMPETGTLDVCPSIVTPDTDSSIASAAAPVVWAIAGAGSSTTPSPVPGPGGAALALLALGLAVAASRRLRRTPAPAPLKVRAGRHDMQSAESAEGRQR